MGKELWRPFMCYRLVFIHVHFGWITGTGCLLLFFVKKSAVVLCFTSEAATGSGMLQLVSSGCFFGLDIFLHLLTCYFTRINIGDYIYFVSQTQVQKSNRKGSWWLLSSMNSTGRVRQVFVFSLITRKLVCKSYTIL